MPEGTSSMPVSLRVPADLIETLDKIAAALERPRSWVMLRALRQYIADEGREVARLVAEFGRLDLQDLGAEIAEALGRERAGQDPGQVDDPDALERAGPAALLI